MSKSCIAINLIETKQTKTKNTPTNKWCCCCWLKAIMIWLLALKQTIKKIKDDDNDVLLMDDE